jgi:glutamate synthase (NADPH/NADH) small chain
VGGLLRYGIPEFKMEKRHIDRRVEQMIAEGVKFRTGVNVGIDRTGEELKARYDAVVLTVGATAWRDLDVPGRTLRGIHQAMEYLPGATRVQLGDSDTAPIDVAGLDVVIIGGGDTGADCLGTALRQGARSVTQLEIMPQPPVNRPASAPWPTYPMVYRVTSAHEEGGTREYAVSTVKFVGADSVEGLEVVTVEARDGGFHPVAGTERIIPAQAVFLAMGFVGPERGALLDQLGVELDSRGNIARDDTYATSVPGVFAAGDCGRGQSLIVWAIAEGRSVAAHVDAFLTGGSSLPIAVQPTARALL